MKLGHRMSSLPQSRYCGKSALLSAQYGSSLRALISQCYHAKCAASGNWRDMCDRLPADLRADVLSWEPPTVVEVPDQDGILRELDYGHAHTEVFVALNRLGFYVHPGDERAVTEGHLDMAWTLEGCDCAFVADIKATRWTVLDYEDSLQLHAYALAYAQKMGLSHYRIGIWTTDQALWWWSRECVSLDSPEAARYKRAVVTAALNQGEAVTGPHCANCWGRLHCPEFLLPAALSEGPLRAICEGLEREPSDDEILDAVRRFCALKQLLTAAEPQLKALATRRTVQDPASGKIWYGRMRKGRESTISVKEMRERLGEDAEQYIQRGTPYPHFDWYLERK